MNTLTCYRAVFNVGKVDVWSSEMYLDKDAIFDELEEAKDEIADAFPAKRLSTPMEIRQCMKCLKEHLLHCAMTASIKKERTAWIFSF